MLLLLARRSLAFLVDAFLISIGLGVLFWFVVALWHFLGGNTIDTFSYSAQFRYPQNWVGIVAVLLAFAFRDAFGNSRFGAGLRLFRLQVRMPTDRHSTRLLLALIRTVVFFLGPVLLVDFLYAPWNELGDDWMFRGAVWSVLFVTVLIPVSLVISTGYGIHDVVSRTYVAPRIAGGPTSKPSLLRALASVFVASGLAGVFALSLELANPKVFARISDLVSWSRHLSIGVQGAQIDGASREVVKLREFPGGRFATGGTDRLLPANLPADLFEQLTSQIVEWKVVYKVNEELAVLRNGIEIPAGVPYMHVTLLVTRDAFEDHFFANTISYVAGKSLLDANADVPTALVSLVRTTRVGPQMFLSQSDVWVARESRGRDYALLPPSKTHSLWFYWRSGIREGMLSTLWGVND